LRKRRTPPNKIKGKSLISFLEDGRVHTSRHDSMAIASDLIAFENSGLVIGVPENLEPCVLAAYSEFKNNPSKLDEYYKLDRASKVN
tara:strand:- start:260 stop:520 length:261 start_codon:yes stop_codon:yes gene_type:complete